MSDEEQHQERPHAARQPMQSIHAMVMADPDSRYAYFNTSQGMLTGNPAHKDMDRIRRLLDDNRIVYLYEPDTSRPRPTFYSQGIISIGLEEISEAAARLVTAP